LEIDMEGEKKYFECLSCGRESVIVSAPRCAECGSGAGVISPTPRVQPGEKSQSQEAFRRAAALAKGKSS
jgi:ribosomal protein L37E